MAKMRTNEDEVKAALSANGLFPNSEVSLVPYITSAVTIVDDIATTATEREITVSAGRLKLIETYIAAHFYALADPQPEDERTGRASIKYQGETGKYWELTWWGQMASTIDPTNTLKQGVRVGLTWLGTAHTKRYGTPHG